MMRKEMWKCLFMRSWVKEHSVSLSSCCCMLPVQDENTDVELLRHEELGYAAHSVPLSSCCCVPSVQDDKTNVELLNHEELGYRTLCASFELLLYSACAG